MRFSAAFAREPLSALTRAFLPSLERFGKTAKVLLTPSHLHVCLDAEDTAGPWAVLSLQQDEVFDKYLVEARHKASIGLRVDLGLVTRVLKAAHALPEYNQESVGIKLAKRPRHVDGAPAGPANAAAGSPTFPCLVVSVQGEMGFTQEIPVSQPLSADEVDYLLRVAGAEVAPVAPPAAPPSGVPSGPPHLECPFYVRIAPSAAAGRLYATCERMKILNTAATVGVCDDGSVHLQVRGHACHVGSMLSGFGVVRVERRQHASAAAATTAAASEGTAARELGVLANPAAESANALVNAVNARCAALKSGAGGTSASAAAAAGPHALVARVKLKDFMHSLAFATQTNVQELWLGVDGACLDGPPNLMPADGVSIATFVHAVFKFHHGAADDGSADMDLSDTVQWDNSVGAYHKLPRYADGDD